MKAIVKQCGYNLIVRGNKSSLYTINNKSILDFTSGIGANSLGYSNPHINKVAIQQINKISHVQQFYLHNQPQQDIEDELNRFCPYKNYVFGLSGTQAIDNAIVISKFYNKKKNVLYVKNAFHGRSVSTLSLIDNMGDKLGYDHLMPNCYMVKEDEEISSDILKDTSCIVIEPIQGERGGYHFISTNFMKYLKKVSLEHNIILIIDEVQSFYRTGLDFAYKHIDFNLDPDIIVISKGVASGFPLGCVIGKDAIMHSIPPGILGGTFQGNCLAFAVGAETLRVFREYNILNNIKKKGTFIKSFLEDLKDTYPDTIQDVRGKGLMIGIEFKTQEQADRLFNKAFQSGLLLTKTSYPCTLRLIPPLNIDLEEVVLFKHIICSILPSL